MSALARVASPWGWPREESGANPELPRSGIENESHPEALAQAGKRWLVGGPLGPRSEPEDST